MAVTIDISNLTQLWDGDSVVTFTGLTPALYTTFFRESDGCLGDIASNTRITGYFAVTSFNIVTNPVRLWMYFTGVLGTLANGGITISIGDGTNRRAYYVGGADYLAFQVASWNGFTLDGNNLPTNYIQEAGSVEPTLTAITQVGIGALTLAKSLGNADNVFWDVCRHGGPIVIGGGGVGTEGTFVQAADDDESTADGKAYGFLRNIGAGVVGIQGSIHIGSLTANSYFKEKNTVVLIEDHGSAAVEIKILGANTFTNTFEIGTKIGTGDTAVGAEGLSFLGGGPTVNIDMYGANCTTLNVYGTKFQNISGGILLALQASNSEFIGNVCDACGQVVGGSATIRNCVFSGYIGTAAAYLWDGLDIKNCQFNNNANGGSNAAAIEHDSGGTFSYDNLKFTGNDYDILNSISATLQDSYSESNQDTDVNLNATNKKVAQVFPNFAPVAYYSHAKFYLKKTGSPTGNAYARLYATDGSDYPTGPPLVSSAPLDVTTLTTGYVLKTLEIETGYATAMLQNYAISIEYDDGDASNYISVGVDNSSPSHGFAGHLYTTSWAVQTWDACFYAYHSGLVIINASNLANPSSAKIRATGTPAGVTVIINTVNLTITVEDEDGDPIENAQTSIQKDEVDKADRTQYMNEDTTALGVATESFNYPGSEVAIVWKVRRSATADDPRYFAQSGTGIITANGFTQLVTLKINDFV